MLTEAAPAARALAHTAPGALEAALEALLIVGAELAGLAGMGLMTPA